jgi:hypothetical protein
MSIIDVPEEEERGEVVERIFKEVMDENFAYVMKSIYLNSSENSK